MAAFLLKEAFLLTVLAQAFTQLHSEPLWDIDLAEKYLKLWLRLDFSAEFHPDVVLSAQSVLVPVWRAQVAQMTTRNSGRGLDFLQDFVSSQCRTLLSKRCTTTNGKIR